MVLGALPVCVWGLVGGGGGNNTGLACTMHVQAALQSCANLVLTHAPHPTTPFPSEPQDDIELEPRFNLGTESLSAGVTWKVGLSKGGRYLPYSA